MKRRHQSRSFAPAMSALEDRCLLSGTSQHGIPEMMGMMGKDATTVSLVSSTISSNMDNVTMTAQVKGAPMTGMTMGTPTGKVQFEMIMRPGMMKMAGMHMGTNNLGTSTLQNGKAALTVKASNVLNMGLKVLYKGDSQYKPSSVTPPMLTMAELMGKTSM